jgi:hypothetical protein
LFVGFLGTTSESDFSTPYIIGLGGCLPDAAPKGRRSGEVVEISRLPRRGHASGQIRGLDGGLSAGPPQEESQAAARHFDAVIRQTRAALRGKRIA